MDPVYEDEVHQIAEQIVHEEEVAAASNIEVIYPVFRTHKPAPPLPPPTTTNHTWFFARESPPLARPCWDGLLAKGTHTAFDAVAINAPKYVAPVFRIN